MKKRAIILSLALAGAFCLAAVPLTLRTKTASALEKKLYDLSLPGYSGESYTAIDLLQMVSDQPVSETERNWLEENAFFEIKYCDAVPASYVDIQRAGGKVTVTAEPYRYTSVSGETVEFTPAKVNDMPFEHTGDTYTLTFDEGTMSEDSVKISYEMPFPISVEDANFIVQGAYERAKEIADEIEKYGEQGSIYLPAREQYESDYAAYQAYLAAEAEYEVASAAYEAYLKEYKKWSRANEAYKNYLADYGYYLKDQAKYEEYVENYAKYQEDLTAFNEYRADLEQYNRDHAAYEAALNSPEMRTFYEQLAYMDFIEEPALLNGAQRTLYSAIMGDSVTKVLAQRDALIETQKNLRQPIELADKATRILREDILPRYHALKTASDEDKYSFYITNHAKMRDAFCDLFRALDFMYRQDAVRFGISHENRTPQYRILLAQLFYICNLLTDGPVANYDKTYLYGGKRYDFDSTYRIDKLTPRELLAGSVIPVDNDNAEPLEGGVPTIPAEPKKPAEVPDPGKPPVSQPKPYKPEPVEDPGEAPMPVDEPIKPEEVKEPVEPKPFIPTDAERALAEAFEAGEYHERPEQTAGLDLKIEATCTKYLRGDFATLRYYFTDAEGEQNFYEAEYPLGGELPDTSKIVPSKESVGYTCEFTGGWELVLGDERVPFDPAALQAGGNYVLYPAFSLTPKRFPVVWEVDGKEYEDTCEYGAIPVFDGVLEKQCEGAECYVFTGWSDGEKFYPESENLPTMSERGAHYTAEFAASSLLLFKGDKIKVSYEEGHFSSDITSAYLPIDISALFARAYECDADVNLSVSGSQFIFSQDAVEAITGSGADSLLISIKESSRSTYSFRIGFRGGQPDCTVSVRARAYLDPSHAYLFDESGEIVPCRVSGKELLFSMKCNAEYSLKGLYRVSISPSDAVTFSTDAKDGLAQPGDTVKVELGEFAPGRELGSIYVVDADGKEIPVTENAFTMPEGDVTVGITAAYHVYTITFCSEGKVVRTQTYRYGEEIVPPVDPSKPSDGEYSFTFTGWDHEVGVCTKDDTFNAVYSQEKLPDPPKAGPSKLFILIKTAKIGLPILLVLICALITFLIVRKVLKRRRAKAAAAAQAAALSEATAPDAAETAPMAEDNVPEEGEAPASDGMSGDDAPEKEGEEGASTPQGSDAESPSSTENPEK